MSVIKRAIFTLCAAVLSLIPLAGCVPASPSDASAPTFASFRDIPGVTSEEIAAIEALQSNKGEPLIYAAIESGEAFERDGEINGFTAKFCQFMSDLFGIEFELRLYAWSDILKGLETGEIAFTGEMTATDDRRSSGYYMTDAIAERSIRYTQSINSASLVDIAENRTPRFAFLRNALTANDVAAYAPYEFETIFVDDSKDVYALLAEGKVDAFFDEGGMVEAATEGFVVRYFFPLITSSVSMTTKTAELAPIITVVQKGLQNEAFRKHLRDLYLIGEEDLNRQKLTDLLTSEEKEYIRDNPVIPTAAEHYNYPLSIYNTYEKQWSGIFFDVLAEVEALTGLSFEIAHGERTEWPDLLKMLEAGEVYLIGELMPTEDRQGRFLWPDKALLIDHYALITKADAPSVGITEVKNKSVGITTDTAYDELFRTWFPNHPNVIAYDNPDDAFAAVARGELDMVMSSQRQLTALTNYLEMSGYKANIIFDQQSESIIGFNKEQAVLRSIFNKALSIIDVDGIAEQWTQRTYDYQAKMLQSQRPWFFGVAALLLCIVILLFMMFRRSRKAGMRLEKLVEKRTEELREAEERAWLMLDANPLACRLWNRDFKIFECNEAAVSLYGLRDKQEYMDRYFDLLPEFQSDGQKSTDRIYSSVAKAFEKGACSYEVMFQKLDGTPMPAENMLFRVRYGDDYVVAAYSRDLREQKKMIAEIENTSAQLAIALDDAKAANSAKSSFLAHMSHEIRTPLNAVVGFTELTLGKEQLDYEIKDQLEKIHASGMTILSIVNDILDISKIESGKFEIYPVQYDTPSLINDIVTLNIVRIGEKPIKFKLSVDENLPALLYGDELRVKQIFNNLLSNAFKYTNEGTVSWRMAFERDGDDVWLVSSIEDTGIGMKPESVQKLFTDYNQVDAQTNRKVEGTGLGLAITKRLVEMMGGTIAVESEYGKGSVFSIRLRQGFVTDTPIGKAAANNLAERRYALVKRGGQGKLARVDLSYAHVLIVDDIVTNLDVVKGMMKPYGVKIDCALSGPQAIEMIRAGRPSYSAVFMDHMMPGMDGIEATRIIREEIGTDYAKNIPIIALTANAIIGNEEMFLHHGFQDFISKPIDMAKLDASLRRWVRDKEREKALIGTEENAVSSDQAVADTETAPSALSADIIIDGLDVQRTLNRFGGDEAALIDVLRSYAANTPPLIGKLDEYLAREDMDGYGIVVHGIKGASYGIFAEETGRVAEALEAAAKADETDVVKAGHSGFTLKAEALISAINTALAEIDAAANLPVVAKPDPALLQELRDACGAFDMDRVDTAMEALDSFKYERGGELVTWLREQVNNMDFEIISAGEWPSE